MMGVQNCVILLNAAVLLSLYMYGPGAGLVCFAVANTLFAVVESMYCPLDDISLAWVSVLLVVIRGRILLCY